MTLTTDWLSFPQEIRDMIFGLLNEDEPNIFHYAAVCREWRQMTQSTAFRQIYITPSSLGKLIRLAYPRRNFLECIRFHIPVRKYDCSECRKSERPNRAIRDTDIVEEALRRLFDALGTWESSDRPLTLDISISSPSDSQHFFKNCFFGDNEPIAPPLDDDEYHGWHDGRLLYLPDTGALNRIFERLYFGDSFWEEIIQVTAITCLQIRRQIRRQIAPACLQRLLTFLPMLQTICYEPWREWYRPWQVETDEDLFYFIQSLNTGQLRRLTIFEDFDDNFARIDQPEYGCTLTQPEPHRIADEEVSTALVRPSVQLECLSVSFLVDATHFLSSARQSTWTWQKLTSLALTSRTLSPANSSHKVDELLQDAAIFANKAPKLTTLTVWNCDGENVCAFIYETSQKGWAKITWRATWFIQLDPVTIHLWESAALRCAPQLSIVWEALDASTALRSRGDAIKLLKLSTEVIHPLSLEQILQESSYERDSSYYRPQILSPDITVSAQSMGG